MKLLVLQLVDAATPPSSNETVLIFNATWLESPRFGYHSGKEWRLESDFAGSSFVPPAEPDSDPVDHPPTHWARVPCLSSAVGASVFTRAAALLDEEAASILRGHTVDGVWDGTEPQAEQSFRDFVTASRDLRRALPNQESEVPA